MMKKFVLSLALLLAAGSAHAADNYTVKDAGGTTVTIKAKDVGAGVQSTQVVPSDATGAPYSAGNPFPVSASSLPLPSGAAQDATVAATNSTLGATSDSAVTGDLAGSVSAKLRGLSKILNDAWDSVGHALKVSIQNATLAATQSGSWNVGQSGTWTVQPGNTPNTTPWVMTTVPATSNGWTPIAEAGLSTTVQTVKASAGELGGYYISNPNSTVACVQVFDTAGTVTLGTTAPKLPLCIPANSAANIEIAMGINFANAIKVAATTTATGSTAPTTALDCAFWFK